MKQEYENLRLCFICHRAPVKKICLNQQCIQNEIYLFCDGCKRDDRVRKYLSQSYEIDAFSNPFCLFSINSSKKEENLKVQQSMINCRQSMKESLIKIYKCIPQFDQEIFQNVVQISQTFNPQKAQQMEYFFKNPMEGNDQLLKKVNTLKWLKENKEIIEDSTGLCKKISDFSLKFNKRLIQISSQIEDLVKQFCDQFSVDRFFKGTKKIQKPVHNKPKQTANKNKNIKIIKQPIKEVDKKSHEQKQFLQKPSNPSVNNSVKQNGSQFLMDLQQSKESQKPSQNSKIIVNNQNLTSIKSQISSQINLSSEIPVEKLQQKKQVPKKPQNPNKKRRPKPKEQIQKLAIQEQVKEPPLILSKIPTKQDYPQNQKLIVNLRNIASIIWRIDKRQEPTPQRQIKNEDKNQIQYQEVNSIHCQIDSQKLQKINLQSIKYLQIQELPKSQKQIFNVKIDGKQTQIIYSWVQYQDNLEQMINLEQIHIFTTLMFLTDEQFLNFLFSCPCLKVISFNCFNPAPLVLENYQNLIDKTLNQDLKILELAGNIPFFENMEFYDLKSYYPQSDKNKKIYDENFVYFSQSWISKQLQDCGQQLNKKQQFPHKNSCWFFRQKLSLLERQRFQTIITSDQNLILSKCFSDLRNCWIPCVQTDELRKIQENRSLKRIEHLTLGLHHVKLQAIPTQFYSGKDGFSRSLNNIKSLNLVNLNIYEFFMKSFFSRHCKELESLKIEFCLGLKNDFYSNLPKYCPKLRKISVNNMTGEIDGDFIFNLTQLETIILPWSEIQYKGLSDMNNQVSNNPLQNHIPEKDLIEQEGQFSRLHYKKWKYINIYGCSWFHTDFFALIDLKSIQHLNIGKCSNIDIQQLVENLKNCENLESLCIDELQIQNKDLFEALSHLPKLKRFSAAHCQNLNFRVGQLSQAQVKILDQMTHLDLRNQLTPIDSCYTLQMKNPKYLIIQRPFDVDSNELIHLTQKQIYTSSVPIKFQ